MSTIDISQVYDLLYRLGITANYMGFFHTARAVYLSAQQPEKLLFVTKWLYPEVAKCYQISWLCVERNIRTASGLAWTQNRTMLEQLSHQALPVKPSASRFIAILTAYLLDQSVA